MGVSQAAFSSLLSLITASGADLPSVFGGLSPRPLRQPDFFFPKKKSLWLFLFPAALKDKGNDAFSKGDYASAVQNYTEGLKKQKDVPALYTNRAQVSVPACIGLRGGPFLQDPGTPVASSCWGPALGLWLLFCSVTQRPAGACSSLSPSGRRDQSLGKGSCIGPVLGSSFLSGIEEALQAVPQLCVKVTLHHRESPSTSVGRGASLKLCIRCL